VVALAALGRKLRVRPETRPGKVPGAIHVPTPTLLLTSTFPPLAPVGNKNPVIRAVPWTSSDWPGAVEPTPTLPPDVTTKAFTVPLISSSATGDQVPMPTLPLVTTKEPCGVVVPIPTLPPLVS